MVGHACRDGVHWNGVRPDLLCRWPDWLSDDLDPGFRARSDVHRHDRPNLAEVPP